MPARKRKTVTFTLGPPERQRRTINVSQAALDRVMSLATRWGVKKSKAMDVLINIAIDLEGRK